MNNQNQRRKACGNARILKNNLKNNIGVRKEAPMAPLTGRELRGAIAHGCRRTLNGISGGISRGTQELRQRGSNLLNFNRHHAG
jgi:hypothetical protein